MTNLGPLTTTYTPTGADCQSTYLGANNDNAWIQYGQPNTTQCVPPNFTAFQNYYYSPGICPSGYTYACEAGVGTSTTQATCCPTGYICRTGIDRDVDPFACASTFTSNTYLSVESYKFTSTTGGSTTSVSTISSSVTVYLASASGYYVEAYGPIVRRSAGDPEWSSASSGSASGTSSTGSSLTAGTVSTATPSSTAAGSDSSGQSGGGLSAGASAGIGVGVGLGCIIFIGCIVAAYIIGKRRRKSQREAEAKGSDKPLYISGVPVEGQVAELGSRSGPWGPPGGYHVVEMDGEGQRTELSGTNAPAELPAKSYPEEYYGPGRA